MTRIINTINTTMIVMRGKRMGRGKCNERDGASVDERDGASVDERDGTSVMRGKGQV